MVNKNQKIVYIILRRINQLDKENSNFLGLNFKFYNLKTKDKA